jgi:Spy/CpxP family protein refolding chaperone
LAARGIVGETYKGVVVIHRSHLTLLALIGTLLGAGVAANAQSAPSPAPGYDQPAGPGGHRRSPMDRAMDGIDLSPTQQSQVRAAETKFKELRHTATPETRRELIADVEAALTPGQRSQFESNLKAIRAQMRGQRHEGEAVTPPNPSAT